MSWYSKIYIFERKYRKKHPVTGFLLKMAMNAPLIMNFIIMAYSYYVYIWLICLTCLTSSIQITIYLIIFHAILFMMFWSLIRSLITSTARVPNDYFVMIFHFERLFTHRNMKSNPIQFQIEFHVDEEVDRKLKEITPMKDGKYQPDESSVDQIREQKKILEDFAKSRKLMLFEVDKYNRLRYCYICRLIKPDRSHHCSSCGFCVLKFDHHCPWINKCISNSNYKYFLLYLFYGCCLIIWIFLSSSECLIRYFISEIAISLLEITMIILLMLICIVFGFYPFGELMIYHISGNANADYNIGIYENFYAALGWGFWGIPINTSVSNGLKFPLRYR
ncbi:unnamed protein product [Dracunculus medinensis]|uniref:Palmitoyltransferase n=1 Tax=Dracunculus medinensis TaxID=318479 RepID=A0A158Q4B9_DRAME|nr:unnamed protein product [Dracunculus medinensis]